MVQCMKGFLQPMEASNIEDVLLAASVPFKRFREGSTGQTPLPGMYYILF